MPMNRLFQALEHISRAQNLLMAETPPETTPQSPASKQVPHHNPPSLPTSPAQQTKRTKTTPLSPGASTTMSAQAGSQTDGSAALAAALLQQEAALGASIPLQVKILRDGAKAPTRGSKYSAGYDLYVCEAGIIPAKGKAMLSTGISIACPPGTYARVAPRSGLAAKHGLQTGAGVIDYDYRGEVKVLLFNHSDTDFKVEAGDRMAQMVLERIVNPDVVVVEELEGTERGAGGFGSTGGFGVVGAGGQSAANGAA